jgi:hypothetical protein
MRPCDVVDAPFALRLKRRIVIAERAVLVRLLRHRRRKQERAREKKS